MDEGNSTRKEVLKAWIKLLNSNRVDEPIELNLSFIENKWCHDRLHNAVASGQRRPMFKRLLNIALNSNHEELDNFGNNQKINKLEDFISVAKRYYFVKEIDLYNYITNEFPEHSEMKDYLTEYDKKYLLDLLENLRDFSNYLQHESLQSYHSWQKSKETKKERLKLIKKEFKGPKLKKLTKQIKNEDDAPNHKRFQQIEQVKMDLEEHFRNEVVCRLAQVNYLDKEDVQFDTEKLSDIARKFDLKENFGTHESILENMIANAKPLEVHKPGDRIINVFIDQSRHETTQIAGENGTNISGSKDVQVQ